MEVESPFFDEAEAEMKAAGFDLNKIPQSMCEEHLWADGLLLWWVKYVCLPTADELAADMFDEWDDPVDASEAEVILRLLTG